MAELEPIEPQNQGCCSSRAQESCCQPEEKPGCCGADTGGSCGCGAGSGEDVREVVRQRYAAAARSVEEGRPGSCGPSESACGCATDIPDACGEDTFGPGLYDSGDQAALPDAAKLASLGCGNPTAVAELHEGETVLDLGSGGGIDVLLSARRIGPTGKAYGLDMTDEMLELAARNQRQAGIENAEFLKGTIEKVPLADGSVDVIISNCVINLSGDKPAVFREAARVLRPGGRFAVSDVVADEDMDDETRRDMQQWTGCIAGALTRVEFERELAAAGFEEIGVRETHRVHDQAAAAIIRARLRS
jgi:arsenite methyltransferase